MGGPPPPADLGTIAARVAAGFQSRGDASAPYSHPGEVAADVAALWAHCRAAARPGDPIMCAVDLCSHVSSDVHVFAVLQLCDGHVSSGCTTLANGCSLQLLSSRPKLPVRLRIASSCARACMTLSLSLRRYMLEAAESAFNAAWGRAGLGEDAPSAPANALKRMVPICSKCNSSRKCYQSLYSCLGTTPASPAQIDKVTGHAITAAQCGYNPHLLRAQSAEGLKRGSSGSSGGRLGSERRPKKQRSMKELQAFGALP